jgi:hypothetical protein
MTGGPGLLPQQRAVVHPSSAPGDVAAPFGGDQQPGNGRKWGQYGAAGFLESGRGSVASQPSIPAKTEK